MGIYPLDMFDRAPSEILGRTSNLGILTIDSINVVKTLSPMFQNGISAPHNAV